MEWVGVLLASHREKAPLTHGPAESARTSTISRTLASLRVRRPFNLPWSGKTDRVFLSPAVWISPVNKNYEGPRTVYGDPYHGYWVTNIEELNSRFGTADDLKALSAELHRRNMWVVRHEHAMV